MGIFLNSREGVTQRDPLSMVAYGIGVIPFIKGLKAANPDATQLWYGDDAGALSAYDIIELYFNSLKNSGPGCGYYT